MFGADSELIAKHKGLIESLRGLSDEVWSAPIKALEETLGWAGSEQVHLAEYDVSLSKWFDFYIMPEAVEMLVKDIVLLSISLLGASNSAMTPTDICGQHENGACIKHPLGPRWMGGDKNEPGWPALPAEDAVNFGHDPEPRYIVPGNRLYRILGSGENSNVRGAWWFFDYRLQNVREWRSRFAVLEKWNSGEKIVSFEIKSNLNLKVWTGSAASQQSRPDCILWGGSNQVWTDPFSLPKNISEISDVNWPIYS